MAISARKGKVTTNTYDVSGDTLAEIWADIQKNGPTYNGKKRAGLTTCEANMDASSSKMEFTTTESEAKMTAGTLT